MLITEMFGDDPYGPEDEIRDTVLLEIADIERAYLATENPLYVWWALQQCCRFSIPVPPWALEYLGKTADRFEDLLMKESERSKKSKSISWGSGVLEAIGFKAPGKSGRGTVFSRAARDVLVFNLARTVAKFVAAGNKLDIAFDLAARDHKCSRTTVRRAWERHEQDFTTRSISAIP